MNKIKRVGLFLLGALFFSIPISTGASNIFLSLAVILAFFSIIINRYRSRYFNIFWSSPILTFSLFFIFLLLAAIVGQNSLANFLSSLNKYLEILFVPFLAFLISGYARERKWLINAIAMGLFITLVISYLRYFDVSYLSNHLVKNFLPKLGDPSNPTVFKWQITHNFFMSFVALFWGYVAWDYFGKKSLWFYLFCLLALAAFFNVLFMVHGRVGYLVLFSGIVYFFVIRFKYSGFFYGLVAVVFLIILLFFISPNFNHRIIKGFSEILFWSPTYPSESSMGLRIEFIYNSGHLIYNNWLFGVGLGNFSQAYSEYARSLGMSQSANPHNQYILFLVETGLFGLIAFLALNYVCWKSSAGLSDFWKHATRIVLLSYGVANLFNSFLFDFSESLFFSLFMALAFSELIKLKKSAAQEN